MRILKKLFIFIILIFSNINFTFADTFFKCGRIILLGNRGSGKSAFIRALIDKRNADESVKPTTKNFIQEHIIFYHSKKKMIRS